MPTLDVPGAHLYYEVTGRGPVLLLITGAPADATTFAGMVPILSQKHGRDL
jgi:pimeloyl-ACP methyl ester carboxylesterase